MKYPTLFSFMPLRLGALLLVIPLLALAFMPGGTPTVEPLYAAVGGSCLVAPIGIVHDAFENPQLGIAKGDTVYSDSTYKNKPMRRFFR